MNVEVQAPVEFAGDLMGDMNGRRGRISGMDTKGGTQIIRRPSAHVGNAELSERPDLDDARPRIFHHGIRSLRFRPRASAGEKIVAAAKAAKTGEEEEEE